ncbi:ENTH domain-containing protein [Rutstroemia sp. NJR-2017a BBW]|nr:ENTH domain-containing protein [Rutstroemia sp. NJR-2017a BBW]
MSSSFEKSVKGATKIKAAPPKSKYIEHILIATHAGEAGVAEVFRALQNRLRDSTWTVVFKSLITVHLMIREGSPDVTLAYLARHRSMLAISSFSDVQTQGRNIRHYTNYLTERARSFRDTKCDFVRGAEGRLEKLSVEKGLLRETESVQHQITALLKCDVLDNEPENEITITVFRMLVLDLLALFHVINQAMINILGHFFEMSKPDAERAMEIYRNFTRQTDFVVSYLSVARQYEHQTRVEVPKLKHAPVNLGKQLEDYLMDPDFEVNRRQYLAEQESKGGKSGSNGASKPFSVPPKSEADSRAATGRSFPDAGQTSSSSAATKPTPKAPDADLIDFFDSIDSNPQAMSPQGGMPQASQFNGDPFAQMQQQQLQANGFAQPQPSFQNPAQFQQQQLPQQQTFNTGFNAPQQVQQQPQPMQPMQPNFTGAGFGGYTPQQNFQPSGLASIPQDSSMNFQQQVQPQRPATSGASLAPQPTGNTNPFRQSQFVNTATGMGWQNNQQPIGGGLDHLETVPVFPRPAQQQAWQQ